MRKTNDNSRPALEDHHTLADSELDAVTGGDLAALPELISGVQRILDAATTAIIRNAVLNP